MSFHMSSKCELCKQLINPNRPQSNKIQQGEVKKMR